MTLPAGQIDGACLCGAVTLRVDAGHDPRPGACHCRLCQRWSGGLFLSFSVPAADVTLQGPVTRYASTAFAERAFCGICGTHLWMRDTSGGPGDYDLMPGLFDAARDWPLQSEIYTDRAFASVRLAGDHRRATRAEYEATHQHTEGDA